MRLQNTVGKKSLHGLRNNVDNKLYTQVFKMMYVGSKDYFHNLEREKSSLVEI